MSGNKDVTYYNFKGFFKYISNVVSWTIFTLLIIVGVLLLYYYISLRLYSTKGEKYAPKFSVYTIVSGSMEPTINIRDVIINKSVDNIDDVKVNDVVTFISTWNVTQGMTITHRVVGKKKLDDGSTCLITRGDNNTQADATCVTKNHLIGVTKAVLPGFGNIQVFLSSKLGLLMLIIIPALYIIVKDIFKLFKLPIDKKKKENNDKNKDDMNGPSSVDGGLDNASADEVVDKKHEEIIETKIDLAEAYNDLLNIQNKDNKSEE